MLSTYALEIDVYNHLVFVTYRFCAPVDNPCMYLASWIPGSYMVREYAKHVEQVSVVLDTQENVDIQKINKNTWQVEGVARQSWVTIRYAVYCADLSVRGSFVDTRMAYLNFVNVCMVAEGEETTPSQLSLTIPHQLLTEHNTVCTLHDIQFKPKSHLTEDGLANTLTFDAHDYYHIIDSTFVYSPQCAHIVFDVQQIPHRMVIVGRQDADVLRLQQDLKKIVHAQIQFFADKTPFHSYTFIVLATENLYGGLEHTNSTSLITPRYHLPTLNEPEQPSDDYLQFLGLCSHEYFHAWLVKTIRPKGFTPPDVRQECYTPYLWLFEGFTSFYDDLFLFKSGLISFERYLQLLEKQLMRHENNKGKQIQSLAESSFDAWIKYYRPDENTPNSVVSYYVSGSVFALCVAIELHQRGSNLMQLMQRLYQDALSGRTVDCERLCELSVELCGCSLDTVWQQTTHPLPAFFWKAGLESYLHVDISEKDHVLGMQLDVKEGMLTVRHVYRDSIASFMGIATRDVIIAVNGLKATKDILLRTVDTCAVEGAASALQIHYFKGDELCMATWNLSNVQDDVVRACDAVVKLSATDTPSLFVNG